MAVRARVSGALISFASISVLCAMGPSASLVGALTSGEEDATMEGSSSSEEQCTWYVVGVPSSISMVSEEDAPYRGDELAVEDVSAEALRVYASGNATGGRVAGEDTFVQCTAYGEVTRPELSVSLAERTDEGDGIFVASYGESSTPDTNLNFSILDNALTFAVTPDVACHSPATVGDGDAWSLSDATFDGETGWEGSGSGGGAVSLPSTVMEIADIANVTSPVNDIDGNNTPDDVDPDETDNCGFTWTIGTTLPDGKTPAGFGSAYTWAGPTIRFALTTPSS